jgi:adenine-specific DNA-methyltransferase
MVSFRSAATILDFFAGSSSTAHAVLELNKSDGGNRRFILVQIPEILDIEAATTPVARQTTKRAIDFLKSIKKPLTIAEISKERIRRVGANLVSGGNAVDTGFRVLKIDTSNMADVYYAPDALDRSNVEMFVDNIRPDRTAEDLLFQVMLDWGIDLALPIAKRSMQGKEVYLVDETALVVCFEGDGCVDEDFVKELAKVQPLRVVFRDAGFKDSSVKINVEQIFKLLSPATEVKCI